MKILKNILVVPSLPLPLTLRSMAPSSIDLPKYVLQSAWLYLNSKLLVLHLFSTSITTFFKAFTQQPQNWNTSEKIQFMVYYIWLNYKLQYATFGASCILIINTDKANVHVKNFLERMFKGSPDYDNWFTHIFKSYIWFCLVVPEQIIIKWYIL